jgi:anti-sigma factor RsiW
MTPSCDANVSDERLLDYWAGDLASAESDELEAHLFVCPACVERLERLAALGTGVATLVRQGRISGIISRATLNRMQRDGVHVRMYALSPGETVPCAVFPDDDVVVVALRAKLSGVPSVRLRVTAPDASVIGEVEDTPVATGADEILWATPGAFIRRLPSARVRLELSVGERVLADYTLDHTA